MMAPMLFAHNLALLAAAAALVGLVRLIGQRGPGGLEEATLRAELSRDFPDFAGALIILGRDGRSALAIEPGGQQIVLWFLLGARPICWSLPADRLTAAGTRFDAADRRLVIDTGEVTRRRVTLALPPDLSLDRLGLAPDAHRAESPK